MKELSICMTHYNRKKQLLNTLRSIEYQVGAKELTEIIIVDDVSETALTYSDFDGIDLDIKLVSIHTKNKWWINPCVAFNAAFNFIHGKRVIIQNAECMHVTNIIQYVIDNLKMGQYIAMSALSLTRESTENIKEGVAISDIDLSGAEWYCHSEYRAKAFNFCSAIYAEDLIKIGGFDNRFSEGIWFDDDALLISIEKAGIEIKIEDNQRVFHQYHDKIWENLISSRGDLLQKNRVLIDSLK
jgi:glycosyltransferase involved in cell wall biosynthesis